MIEEDDQVQPSVPLTDRVVVEVDVVVEFLSSEVLVRPAAEVLRIEQQIIDPGDL